MSVIKTILIIGAGQVGSSIARYVLLSDIANVIIYDVQPGVAEGMALDLSHCQINWQLTCIGTDDIDIAFARADMVVLTAGVPRHKDQKRIDLLSMNAKIALEIARETNSRLPSAPFFVISNPVDIISTVVKRAFPEMSVFGMGCGLDTHRFRYYIANFLKLPSNVIEAFIVGAHNEMMIPLWDSVMIGSAPLTSFLTNQDRNQIMNDTMLAGDYIVKKLGRGSSEAAGILGAKMIESYFSSEGNVYSIDCFMEDCFGVKNCMISLPCLLVANTIQIILPNFTEAQLMKLGLVAESINTFATHVKS